MSLLLAVLHAAASPCCGVFCSRAGSTSGATESPNLERVLRLQLLQLHDMKINEEAFDAASCSSLLKTVRMKLVREESDSISSKVF